MLSYSKSLATCLLKYNKYIDNELHICMIQGCKDYILYISPKGNIKCKLYSINDRIDDKALFHKGGQIQLLQFIIDVSNNSLVDEYLRYYTGVGKKVLASPEKDSEVIVMNPPNDLIINQYMDAVYILYALQLRYNFLSDTDIRQALILKLMNMEAFRFEYCPQEREAFIKLIRYLSVNWRYEYRISKKIYDYLEKCEHLSIYYDSILQFYGIMKDDFEESYHNSTYNENVISDLFWEYCYKYLKH